MKKKVKAQVINADWEIRKYRMRQDVRNFIENAKPIVKEGCKCLLIGAGIGAVVVFKESI